ncbi:MAG TPA: phage tail protein [Cyanobacteria bacterium UBA11149]|nr:phage tail protein [Cyanobacteria bacterium UBA11367]HBE57972.1 phage tail protein [Cyanobacteria bacterium UBA11366]HBK63148.1 phage tail protein [Cyanobacteria bacterium UBA11166]HBR75735.1 phage tail protein [Cyanobacteria bacterium UBA11159]HBS68925.1 phage tail protein [Cyanobacteria bacterium UBA11153]HBW91535.1 phage tail protein [Cyanobacteria bacterium UBA11149]HCA96050.1 phage tail protein [Cyanobacteria bacterium UBA9226]
MTDQTNYVTANHFYVEIESQLSASFSECSGFGVQIDKEVFSEGGVNNQQRIFLKQAKFNDVTLKRGITDNTIFWNWINNTLSPGKKERRNINILVFNQAGETMQCWTLTGAVPVAWKTAALQANSNAVAIEELTLAYEGLKVVAKQGGGASTKVQRDASGSFPGN